MQPGINNLWPTPVLVDTVTDTELLTQFVEELFQTINFFTPPSDFQNDDILSRDSVIIKKFKEQVVIPTFNRYLETVIGDNLNNHKKFRMRSWITGTGAGYYIPVHNHSGAVVSSVFYLFCEEKNSSGEIALLDPRINANRGYDGKFKNLFAEETHCPKSGDVLMFPSFLYHYTKPFDGKHRLAMPVDLFL